MVASIYTRTGRCDSRTGRLAVEFRSILHPERGTGVDLMMERWAWSIFGDRIANLGLINFKIGLCIKVNVNAGLKQI